MATKAFRTLATARRTLHFLMLKRIDSSLFDMPDFIFRGNIARETRVDFAGAFRIVSEMWWCMSLKLCFPRPVRFVKGVSVVKIDPHRQIPSGDFSKFGDHVRQFQRRSLHLVCGVDNISILLL